MYLPMILLWEDISAPEAPSWKGGAKKTRHAPALRRLFLHVNQT